MTTATQTHTLEFVLDALPQLRLKNHRGDLRVHHDAEPGVVSLRLVSNKPVDFEAVEASSDGTTVTVRIPQLPGDDGVGFSIGGFSLFAGLRGVHVDVEVHLPSGAGITLETGMGDITVSGASGDAWVKSGAGDASLEDARNATVITGAGNIRAGHVYSGHLRTGTGDVFVEHLTGDSDVTAGAGDVTLPDLSGAIRANTGAGDVNATLSEGRLDVKTGMGDVNVQVPTGMPVWQDLTTGLGEVRSSISSVGEPEPGEPYLTVTARTGAGDVTLSH